MIQHISKFEERRSFCTENPIYFSSFDITLSRAHFLSSHEMSQELRFHSPSGWGTLKVFDFSLWHAPWLVCLARRADLRIVSAGFMRSSASHPSFWHPLHSRAPILLVFLNVWIGFFLMSELHEPPCIIIPGCLAVSFEAFALFTVFNAFEYWVTSVVI